MYCLASMRWLFGCIAFLLCALAFARPALAQTAIDPRWGVLGEMAEHDFAIGNYPMTMRWKVPNHVITQIYWGLGGRETFEYELNPATGELEHLILAPLRKYRTKLTVLDDGTVMMKGEVLYQRASPGTFRTGQGTILEPIPPGHKAGTRLASYIASGKLRAADPAMGVLAAASPAATLPATAGRTEPRPGSATASGGAAVAAAAAPAKTFVPGPGTGRRVALVVGIGKYASLGSLPNPTKDARAIAARLRAVGFDVDLVLEADQRTLKAAIARLGERMSRAGSGATGLFFFAGHGIQSRGINYLIPANAQIAREADVDLESVAADTALMQMQEAAGSTNIVILDACRNMPLTRSFRSGQRGLAQMDAPNGSFIAYSTAPGSVAADGEGENSPFAAALMQELDRPAQPIEVMFRNVRRAVLRDTEGMQVPWDSSSLVEPFYFIPE